MTSWNRRLSAASGRPANEGTRTSRAEVLAEAMAAGVVEDDQHALFAMANIARDRPGFHKTLDVRALLDGEALDLEFEILYDEDGPLVRLSDNVAASATLRPEPGELVEAEPDGGADIVNILTDTLVETPDLVAIFASVGHEALWANDAFVTVVPIRESDKIWFVELLDEWSKGHYEVKVLPALVKYGRWRGRLTLITGVDTTMAVSAVIVAHRDKRGEIEAVSLVARDMAEIRGVDSDLVSDSRFAALVENAADVIAVLRADGVVEYASPAAVRILGGGDGSLIGTNVLDLIHPDDRPADLVSLARPDEQGIGEPVELRIQAADGAWRYLEVVVSDLTTNQSIGGIVLNARDVTERVAAINALASKALTDVLTELPGRVRLLDRLATALQAPAGASVVALLIDLDRVRNVNEHLGRDAGDELLRTAAHRLAAEMPEGTFLSRLGGDEFVVVMAGVGTMEGLRLAHRLRDTLAEPMELAGGPFDITACVGIASAPTGAAIEPEALLQDAERAVAQAKASGRDRIEVYTDEMAQLASRRRTVEQTLRHALDNDGVRVHYQPIVELASGHVVAAEALLRVHDGDGELLSPAEFIEAAESSGLIARLGAQVLQVTCEQLAVWNGSDGIDASGATVPTEISVNMSPRQLADPALPTYVVEALNSAGVQPDKLWLEITESILIGAQSTIDASISYLRALGVKIGLDDFGAGQSSLGYLKRFPLDFVKIDRTLIAGLGINEHDTAIVRATVELAHNLGLIVVAVGVETDEQLEYLQLLGCDRAQGYHFSPPVTADELTARGHGS